MQKIIFFFLGIMILITACHTDNKNTDAANKTDSVKFYPLSYFWDIQLREIDSSPFYIYKIITEGKKKDSTEINNATCRQLATYFKNINLDDTLFKNHYKESIYRDESIASITFNYTDTTGTQPINSIDILLDNVTQDVKRIFIKKIFSQGDTLIYENAGWKTSSNFYINTTKEIKGQPPQSQQLTVVWNQNN